MKKVVLAAIGAATLVVAGCSSTTSGTQDAVAPEGGSTGAPSNGITATPKLGDDDYVISVTCTGGVQQTDFIPDGATSIEVVAVGAAGWQGAASGTGLGGAVTANIPINANWGTTLYTKVGCQGGGSGGWPNGGEGGGDNYHGGGGSTSLETSAEAFTPIIIAGGGGGSDGGDDNGGGDGNGNSTSKTPGAGGDGSGDCGGGGGTQTGAGSAASTDRNKGSDGAQSQGGAGAEGGYADGGGGGGGYYGGAGGCGSSDVFYPTTEGSGGAGSSWADPTAKNVVYTVSSYGSSGYLGMTFMCGASACEAQPGVTPVS